MDQTQTPLFDGLMAYRQNEKYSFHVPGHKDGLIFAEKGLELFNPLLSIDATEVADLDDLYHPLGVIAEAEALLTDYYGTLFSYFLVNGSTVGNLAMIMAACRPGDVVLVQRNSHKSVFNALKLARVNPVFLSPDIDEDSQIAVGIGNSVLMEAVRRYPQAKALVLTYPNYYGMAPDYRGVIQRAHACGLAVLVDEAHGAHFKIGAPVPESTLDMGADIVVHSAHKMLPAMTMGAYLHINSLRVSKERVQEALQILQSSSPSYVIMASLDLARYYLANLDKSRLDHMIEKRCGFVQTLEKLANVMVMNDDAGGFRLDPFKVTVQLRKKRLSFAGTPN
ncbi:aminotransferase class I/II-fold pyridoxal phosphate-dependent enzyme [Terrilactibacillus sp. S3-3]|nr:aminotransferase class I/II-fold pyridoxal phosphate-dependent enzyme [Terrilactibacillus sp. S3-3]